MKVRIVILIMLWGICSSISAQARETLPWTTKKECILGMPYLGNLIKPFDKGVINDIFAVIYRSENILFIHKEMPYARTEAALKAGTIHMTLAAKGKSKKFLQGRPPLRVYTLTAVYLRKTPFSGVQSMQGARVAYLHGFDLKRFIPQEVEPHLLFDLTSGYHLLENGQVSYVLGDMELLRSALHESHLSSSEFVFTPLLVTTIHPYFTPTDYGRFLCDIYDRRMPEIRQDGELEEIFEANDVPDYERLKFSPPQ